MVGNSRSSVSFMLNYIGIPLLALTVWAVHTFVNGGDMVEWGVFRLFNISSYFTTEGYSLLISILNGLSLTIAALLLPKLNDRSSLIDKSNFLPSYLLILLCGIFPVYSGGTVFGIAALFVTLALIRSLDLYQLSVSGNRTEFISAIYFSLGSLFFPPLLLLFIVHILAMVWSLKGFSWSGLFTSIIGFLLPWFYLFALSYIIGGEELIISIADSFYQIWLEQFSFTISLSIPFVIMILLGVISVWFRSVAGDGKPLYVRAGINLHRAILILMFVIAIFTSNRGAIPSSILAISISFVLSEFVLRVKYNIVRWLVFIVLIALNVIAYLNLTSDQYQWLLLF